MPRSAERHPPPVTADDLDHAVQLALTTLRAAPLSGWGGKAGPLTWDCWESVEHLCGALFSYAAVLAPVNPPLDRDHPFVEESRRPGGPENAVHVDRSAAIAGLSQALEVVGALLVTVVRAKPSDARAYHSDGVTDPEGIAAMGIVETLVHTHDVAEGLGLLAWTPPVELCSRALTRLFPDAPTTTPPWLTLLWATGRVELPGRPRLTRWSWHPAPR